MTAEVSKTKIRHIERLARRSIAKRNEHLPPLPGRRYDIVYMDPPWHYYGSPIKDAAAGKHYALMAVEEIAQINIWSILNEKAAVFMWATGPRLNHGIHLIEQWGLTYRGVIYNWVKTNRKGEPIAGQGIPPTFTKPTSEFVLAATTNATGRPFPILDLAQAQVVLHPRPGVHGQKPAIFRELIVQLCGDRPRIDLFAQSTARGWDSWGAEVGKCDE